MEPTRWKGFRTAVTVQAVIAVLVLLAWFYIRTSTYLAGPPDPDAYAFSWGFQLTVVLPFYLLGLAVVLGCLITLEAILVGTYLKIFGSHAEPRV